MENFQTIFNSNTTSANEALKSPGSLFKAEKTQLQEIRTGLKTDHESFQATISSQLFQLKDELVKESILTDSLTLKSEEAKVLSTKIEASEKQGDEDKTAFYTDHGAFRYPENVVRPKEHRGNIPAARRLTFHKEYWKAY
ncbi:unnamed protein product [Lactuca virosa]|uniref:Uncharacterized protein n=1 Tax=Lactuca virosa TaxID=75947 RepID=A0AAU9NFZ9_9ASTR|nr:unnamed protein product [Lactuca virosa]